MSRWVVLEQQGLKAAQAGHESPDGALARITKYVPAEILSGYTAAFSILVSPVRSELSQYWQPVVPAGLMLIFFVVTIFYVGCNTSGSVRKVHLCVTPLAFVAWAYPISSALLGHWFDGLAAAAGQVFVIVLSLMFWRAPN